MSGNNFLIETWTPVLTFGGASTGITYSVQTGYFCRWAGLGLIQFNIQLSNVGSATGAAVITGMPYACANTAMHSVLQTSNLSPSAAQYYIYTNLNIGGSLLSLFRIPANGNNTALSNTAFANNSVVQGSFIFKVQ